MLAGSNVGDLFSNPLAQSKQQNTWKWIAVFFFDFFVNLLKKTGNFFVAVELHSSHLGSINQRKSLKN